MKSEFYLILNAAQYKKATSVELKYLCNYAGEK